MVCGVCCVVYGVWCVVCGVWCVVFGVWCVVCGEWCVVCGVWCVVCGVWCVVCGSWSGLGLTRVDRLDRLDGCDRERKRVRRDRGVLDPQFHADLRRGLPTPFAFSLHLRTRAICVAGIYSHSN